MAKIYESKNFLVESVQHPHVDREDGGHIKIIPKMRLEKRQLLMPEQAVELMRLTVVAGEAMMTIMNARGVDVGRINYQDMGNWTVFMPEGPYFYYNLYGRAKSAKYQKYGEAVFLPSVGSHPEFYNRFLPLDAGDVKAIGLEIKRLMKTEKYSDAKWMLK